MPGADGSWGTGIDRRQVLKSMLVAGFNPAASGVQAATPHSSHSLAALAATKNLIFGMEVTYDQGFATSPVVETALSQSAILVPGNELKWIRVEPEPGRFAFSEADAVIDLAHGHRLKTRGHTLVWHEALPFWVAADTTRSGMGIMLSRHIRTVCRRYAGRMYAWDVVNEPIQPGDGPDGLRRTPFLAAFGEDYIDRAFRLAKEADPAAILTLNEYDLERDTEWQSSRRVAMLELLNRLVRRGVPVGALGIQGHIDPAKGRLDPDIFRTFIRAVDSLGLDVFITELDVIDRTMPADVAVRDATAAELTRAYLTAALAEPCVRLVTTWGVSDALNWVDGNPATRRLDGLASRPHLYDDAFRPKPMRAAVAAAFRNAPPRGSHR